MSTTGAAVATTTTTSRGTDDRLVGRRRRLQERLEKKPPRRGRSNPEQQQIHHNDDDDNEGRGHHLGRRRGNLSKFSFIIVIIVVVSLLLVFVIVTQWTFDSMQTQYLHASTESYKYDQSNKSSVKNDHADYSDDRYDRHYWKPVTSYDWCRPSSFLSSPGDDQSPPPGLVYIKIDKAASSTLAGINIRIARHVGSRVLKPSSSSSSSSSWWWWWNRWLGLRTSSKQMPSTTICSHTYVHQRASNALSQHASVYRQRGETRRRQRQQMDRRSSSSSSSSSLPFMAWTFVREPMKRTVSEFYHFYVSRQQQNLNNITQKTFDRFVRNHDNFQLLYIMDVDNPPQTLWNVLGVNHNNHNNKNNNSASLVSSSSSSSSSTRTTSTNHDLLLHDDMVELILNHVLDTYDFIGIVERMDESLAIMKLLWDLPLGDLIVLSAKQSGGYDDGRFHDQCYRIAPQQQQQHGDDPTTLLSTTTPTKKQRSGNYDYLLYEMVNRSLDNTIEVLGRDIVDKTIQQLHYWQSKAEQQCQSTAIFPCSKDGIRQHDKSSKDCYWFDSGCGYKCVDNVVKDVSSSNGI